MLRTLVRVFVGFIIACLAAGATTVAFVTTPGELTSGTYGVGVLALLAATHSAIFAAPFALVACVIGEWQNIRSWIYYALAGIAIAFAGFLAQYSTEVTGEPSIVNEYALRAFLASGFVAGLVYWLAAGHAAGHSLQPASADNRAPGAHRPAQRET